MAIYDITPKGSKTRRWRVVLYNRHTHKQEWFTKECGRREVETFERDAKTRLGKGTYVAKPSRSTFGELAKLYLETMVGKGRRTSTIKNAQSVLDVHLLPELQHVPLMALQIGRPWTELFNKLRKGGASVELRNRCMRVARAMMNFACKQGLIEARPTFEADTAQPDDTSRKVNRRALTEEEVRAVLAVARPAERTLFGMLLLTGIRPGEAYALRVCDLDLTGGAARICRNYDFRTKDKAKRFTPTKTKAGMRVVALAGWLVAELQAHLERTGAKGEALVFASRTGEPLNPSNVLRRSWYPALERAEVPQCDLYSTRHTFATLSRAGGETAFNTAQAMGHSKSQLVDRTYAHALPSGMASVAAAVAARALGEKPALRAVEGGKQRTDADVRQPLDDSLADRTKTA